MPIIHTYLPASEVKRLSQQDNDYLKRKLEVNCLLNTILNKHINRPLLAELRCILDRQPIARRKVEQYRRNSKVAVFLDGVLVRMEYSNGKVMKQMEVLQC